MTKEKLANEAFIKAFVEAVILLRDRGENQVVEKVIKAIRTAKVRKPLVRKKVRK